VALANYTDLKAAVSSWLHRDDLAAQVPDFIALAEARLNRKMRTRQQMTTATVSATAGVAELALPSGWLQSIRVRMAAPDAALEFMPAAQFQAKFPTADRGLPNNFTIQGASLLLGPTPDAAYSVEHVYFASIPALSDVSPTNWVLTAWPSLYLFAALAEAAPFIGDDERAAMWEAKFSVELSAALDADVNARVSGSALRIRAR